MYAYEGGVITGNDEGYSVTFTSAPNTPATGAPTLSGTTQVGQTLTASTSGISDSDGLANATFSYQWLSSRDADIDGRLVRPTRYSHPATARPSRCRLSSRMTWAVRTR